VTSGLNVGIVGLVFGRDFLPIYLDHPDVADVAVVEPDAERRESVAAEHGIEARYEAIEDLLADDHWDAVHIAAPVRFHAEYSIATLDAGKHCACAVPMATTLDDIDAIVEAQRRADRTYMMMETSAYTREYLTAADLHDRGELGELTMYRGFHIQNLDGFAWYWQGYPPMHYVTHALSPILAITGSVVTTVRAMGSGRLQPHQTTGGFDNPFASEIGLFALDRSEVVADITMSFFRVARSYIEGFSLYGDAMGLEWPDEPDGPLTAFRLRPDDGGRGRPADVTALATDAFADRLPEPIRRYTERYLVQPVDGQPDYWRPAEHGGSHPHLVHEFVSAITESRPCAVAAPVAAAWTAPGVVAHQSALAGGAPMDVPRYA
jgi:predicted dehydrogenase